jgi:uncharacterized protein (DUF111 family)
LFCGYQRRYVCRRIARFGAALEALRRELAKLNLTGYTVSSQRVDRSGISSTKFDVQIKEDDSPSSAGKHDTTIIITGTITIERFHQFDR